jgi:outer membrane protein insertion porin family
MSVLLDEGSCYTLRGITFKNNKAINNRDSLRGLFPISDGDIFSRTKIGKGLENLRRAYGDLGYVNFTSVPETQFDDENRLVSPQSMERDERTRLHRTCRGNGDGMYA